MRFFFASFMFFSLIHSLYCQQTDYVQQVIDEHFSKIEIPVLSQSEMYADFDTLSYLLKNVYPYYYVKSQLTATNYDEKLAGLRKQISKVQQPHDFIWILQKAINLFYDGHLYIPHPQTLSSYHQYDKIGFTRLTPENIVRTYKYYLLTQDSIQVKIKLGILFKYIDGKYYTVRPFKYKNQIYPEGSLLKSINGMTIDTFVNHYYTSMLGAAYDYKNKKYFSEYFTASPDFLNLASPLFVFEDDKKNVLTDTFHVDVRVEGLSKIPHQQLIQKNDNPAVFTVSDSILYIRMPNMFGNDDFYIQEIQKLYDAEHIQKIVIDVRGNPGGSDNVWMNLLSHIIVDTLRQNVALYATNTDKRIRGYLERRNKERNRTDSIETVFLPLLNSELIQIYKDQERIFPNENSIRFNGKIVIMHDENTFSAAGSLVTIAKENDKIITVGYSRNDIAGRGLGPILFELPNTNMVIVMPYVIDYSSVNQIPDFLRNIFPEIECERDFSTYLRYYHSTNPYQLESLLQDNCFLKAISL